VWRRVQKEMEIKMEGKSGVELVNSVNNGFIANMLCDQEFLSFRQGEGGGGRGGGRKGRGRGRRGRS